ncbi:MAG: hypothetical protein EOP83_35240 [Verrucomicrobiaceae bacterium]|nr:MAG: hypothetical protein EOP83_35240 [Verrucomicrobiaceae bacterium]
MRDDDHPKSPDRDLYPVALTPGRKLRLFQTHDHEKQWWNLDEMRFCAKCEHLFVGRDIKVLEDDRQEIHFRCPTQGCDGSWPDWQYPALHL